MAEEQKPVVPPTEAPATEPVVAEAAPVETAETAPAVTESAPAETSTEEQKPAEATATDGATDAEAAPAAAPAAEEAAKTEEKKEPEPIYSGALGYKAPGLVKGLIFSKKYFWFGEEPVNHANLTTYLRGEKPEVAHPTAAWSTVTGKGLLYFVKHADQKTTPSGALNLSEVSDINKEGHNEFTFKLNGHKHTFQASTAAERDGWFIALNKAVEEAKASKEEIVKNTAYTEALEKLGKSTAGASTAKTAEAKPTTTAEGAEPVARTGSSSSSSSSGEDAKKKKKSGKSKSRSVSRGKRASLFGNLLGKKEEAEAKKEEKVEEATPAADAKPEETPVAEPAGTAAPLDAPAVAERATAAPAEGAADEKPVEATPAIEDKAAEPSTTATAEASKPKPTKRTSIFGNFVDKLRSPTTEKKESEVVPTVPPKDKKSPATELPPTLPEEGATEAPAAADETAKPAEEAPAATTPTTPEVKDKRRTSFFGNLGGAKKSEGQGEKSGKLSGLFRKPSAAVKNKDNKPEIKEETPAEAKAEEAAPATEEAKPAEAAAAPAAATNGEPASIGDVVPAAVTVGQDSKSTPPVQAAA